MSDIANPERGEQALVVDGKRYVLRLTLASMVELEEVFGRTFVQAFEGTQAASRSMRDLVLMLWTALRDAHPEVATSDKASVKKIATLIDGAGGLDVVGAQLSALVALNQQPPELAPQDGGDARPPVAAGAAAVDASRGDGSASRGFVAA